jgi:hypothetical protein
VQNFFAARSVQEVLSILPIRLLEQSREGGTDAVPFQDKEHGKNGLLAMFFFFARNAMGTVPFLLRKNRDSPQVIFSAET